MKNDTIAVIGGLAVGGYLLYKSDFFGKVGTGIESIGTGIGGGVLSAGTGLGAGLSSTGYGLGSGLSNTGAGIYQVGTGLGTLTGGSSASAIIQAIKNNASTPYYQLPSVETSNLPKPVIPSPNPVDQIIPTKGTYDIVPQSPIISNVAPSQQNIQSILVLPDTPEALVNPNTPIQYSYSTSSSPSPSPVTTNYSNVAPSHEAASKGAIATAANNIISDILPVIPVLSSSMSTAAKLSSSVVNSLVNDVSKPLSSVTKTLSNTISSIYKLF